MTRSIPSVPGHPLWRNASDLFHRPLEFFRDSYLECGPVFRVRGPGRNYVVIAGPEANEQLLSRIGEQHFDHGPVYAHIARELDSDHYVIATDGERHVQLRRQVAALLTSRAVAPMLPAMLDAATAACRRWVPGEHYEVLPQMHRIVGEQVGVGLANHPPGERIDDAIVFARYSVGPSLGSYPSFMRFNPSYLVAKRRMKDFVEQVIEAHRQTPPGEARHADFIDGLLASVDEDGRPLPAPALFANAQMVYTNSVLYGGPSVAFLLYLILKDRELKEALVAEVDAALEEPLSLDLLRRLPTLMGVVKESMRLHPIALATPRVVRETFEFEGYEIEKGERVLIAGSVCHKLEQVYAEPQRLDIDREYARAPKNTYVPFGGGSHACPAGGFMELVYAVSTLAILGNAELEMTPHDYELRKVVNPFPEPAGDFRMRVVSLRTPGLQARSEGLASGADPRPVA